VSAPKWDRLIAGEDHDLGGAQQKQLLAGRAPGLFEWAQRIFPRDASSRIEKILAIIRGKGDLGPIVSSEVDVDNLDNVVRLAFHMGLRPECDLPLRIARAARLSTEASGVVFDPSAETDIRTWLDLRAAVYSRLMPAPEDITSKMMLLFASSAALQASTFTPQEWNMTDEQLVSRLQSSDSKFVVDTAQQWLAGDLWTPIGTWWMLGAIPHLKNLLSLNASLTTAVGFPCYMYCIKDKRRRRIAFRDTAGRESTLGSIGRNWLVSIATPRRATVTASQKKKLLRALTELTTSTVDSEAEWPAPIDGTNRTLELFR
jgi:hypothetical protein